MFRRFSVNFALFSMVLDAILVALSLFLATLIRPSMSRLPLIAYIPYPLQIPAVLYGLFPVTWVAVFSLMSVYDGRRNLQLSDELGNLTLGTILAGVSQAGALYLSFRDVSRFLYLVFLLISFVFMVAWRLIYRLTTQSRSLRKNHLRQVLIIGAGTVGRRLQEQVLKNPVLGLTIAGFLDDDPTKREHNPDICGTTSDACRVVEEKQIDDVVIALPLSAYQKINTLIKNLHTQPVKLWVIPGYFQMALHKAAVEEFAGIPMLDLRAPALNDYQRLVKRAFDLLVTLLLMPAALLLMGIIAIAIRLEGEGKVLFKQERMGENGRLFAMYKFRTMVPDAETLRSQVEQQDGEGHILYKLPNDPRVTRVGRFLRRTSLDELPQLFNILKGEMSLVGPRPELPYLADHYEPWQRKRFAVPQGLTGWWQINGRSDLPMHLNTEYDLYYVQNYSILLDIEIIIKTLWVVFKRKGAY
jgi:exopolysaccharide biosynthesis polyprenyl glycosylphosphotransferase